MYNNEISNYFYHSGSYFNIKLQFYVLNGLHYYDKCESNQASTIICNRDMNSLSKIGYLD